jgi:NADPH:quinone reductase-like Zn-dependent oxidoreductase
MSSTTSIRRWAVPAWGDADTLALRSDPVPSPLPAKHVLVRVLATTATYTDILILHGNYRPCPALPASPGYDLIGVIEAVASDVDPVVLRVGDRVAAMPQAGCAATHVVLPQEAVYKVRADVEPPLAVCAVLTGVTAYQMLHRAAGDARITGRKGADGTTVANRLLIHGCVGGTGAMLVELAKIAGVPPANIFGTCSAKNISTAREMGIVAIDYAAGDWSAEVLRRTGGEGVDAVFDAVLLGGYYAKSLSCLRRGGKLVAYGLTNTANPGALVLPSVIGTFLRMSVQQKVWSCLDGKEAEFYNVADMRTASPAHFVADMNTVLGLVADKTLQPLIGKVWPFEEAKGAWESIEKSTHKGKQIITVP